MTMYEHRMLHNTAIREQFWQCCLWLVVKSELRCGQMELALWALSEYGFQSDRLASNSWMSNRQNWTELSSTQSLYGTQLVPRETKVM